MECAIAVSRIALVRPERARGIEQLLMRMAQGGQLRGKVSEDQLIGVLDQVRLSRWSFRTRELTDISGLRSRRQRRGGAGEEETRAVARLS